MTQPCFPAHKEMQSLNCIIGDVYVGVGIFVNTYITILWFSLCYNAYFYAK